MVRKEQCAVRFFLLVVAFNLGYFWWVSTEKLGENKILNNCSLTQHRPSCSVTETGVLWKKLYDPEIKDDAMTGICKRPELQLHQLS